MMADLIHTIHHHDGRRVHLYSSEDLTDLVIVDDLDNEEVDHWDP